MPAMPSDGNAAGGTGCCCCCCSCACGIVGVKKGWDDGGGGILAGVIPKGAGWLYDACCCCCCCIPTVVTKLEGDTDESEGETLGGGRLYGCMLGDENIPDVAPAGGVGIGSRC
jgi:hypothetical protein